MVISKKQANLKEGNFHGFPPLDYDPQTTASAKTTYIQTIKLTQQLTYLHTYIHMHKQVHTHIFVCDIKEYERERIYQFRMLGTRNRLQGR